jgi:hypothetical protein
VLLKMLPPLATIRGRSRYWDWPDPVTSRPFSHSFRPCGRMIHVPDRARVHCRGTRAQPSHLRAETVLRCPFAPGRASNPRPVAALVAERGVASVFSDSSARTRKSAKRGRGGAAR